MKPLTGTLKLIRLILRRDRFLLPIWILFISIVPISLVPAITGLYPDEASRAALASTVEANPVFLTFLGHLCDSSLGAIVAWRGSAFLTIVALFSLLTVIRHTRAEEEAGRRELIGSGVVGRQAGLAAALIVVAAADLALGLLIASGLSNQGLPMAGSLAVGFQFAIVGWMFAGIGAVFAQMADRAGTARGMSIGALGLFFMVRVLGDVTSLTWLGWLSPLGWAQRLRPFGDERWWVILLAAAIALVLAVIASQMLSRRDMGSGLISTTAGPATGPNLRGPFSLAWRLHRGLLYGWLVGFVLLGAMIGSVATYLNSLIEGNPQMEEIFARLGGTAALADAYFYAIMGVFAMVASGYAVQAALRLRAEETTLRAEPVLATSVGRTRWTASHLLVSFGGSALLMVAAGAVAGLVHGLNTGDVAGQLPRVMAAALVQLPAVWIMIGLAAALFGLLPKQSGVAWGFLGAFVLLGQIGSILGLPQWVLDISPFTHIPRLPGGTLEVLPLLILAGIAVSLLAAGQIGFRQRDMSRA